jgi:hypothetical protein
MNSENAKELNLQLLGEAGQPDQSGDREARARDTRQKIEYLRALFAAQNRRSGSTPAGFND